MEENMPRLTPPWDSIPWYITVFQSSPVRIYGRQQSQNDAGGTGCRAVKYHANLTECKIKLLYRVKGYEQRLIEGLWLISLGDRRSTDKSFPLIKMTDNNLSFYIKSIFSHLFKKCEVHPTSVCISVSMQVCNMCVALTWNTVRMAAGKVSKFVVGVSSSKLNLNESELQKHCYKERNNKNNKKLQL